MRLRIVLPLAAAGALALPAGALADHIHVVAPGESLTSVAAADGISIAALAAANHLPDDARLIAGAVLRIPDRTTTRRRAATPAPTHSYVVRRGDTLSAIAARAGIGVDALAALNHRRVNGVLLVGATLKLPGAAVSSTRGVPTIATTHPYVVRRGDTLSAIAARAGTTVTVLATLNHLRVGGILLAGATLKLPGPGLREVSSTTTPLRYVIRPGDTLSGIAARAGISVTALAAANRLALNGLLFAGAVLTLPAGSRPIGPPVPANLPPYPTPERVSAAEVEQIAAANGVPASLAAAIGWQESGFNNDLVSSADARGVMQILPRTWTWIQRSLDTGTPLAPASALDNVRGGVLLLHSLLAATNGNEALAAAGYIQGLQSVRRHGMFAVTRRYVADVLALTRMFGG